MEMLFQYRKVQPAQLKPPPLVEIHPMVSNILVDQVENGLDDGVNKLAAMGPNAQNPTGYVNYGKTLPNGSWQTVNPYTGQSIPPVRSMVAYPVTSLGGNT